MTAVGQRIAALSSRIVRDVGLARHHTNWGRDRYERGSVQVAEAAAVRLDRGGSPVYLLVHDVADSLPAYVAALGAVTTIADLGSEDESALVGFTLARSRAVSFVPPLALIQESGGSATLLHDACPGCPIDASGLMSLAATGKTTCGEDAGEPLQRAAADLISTLQRSATPKVRDTQDTAPVAMLPHSPYHAVEFLPIAAELEARGVQTEFWVENDAPAELLALLLARGRTVHDAASAAASRQPQLVVVQNDWREEVQRYRSQLRARVGTRLVAKVEGIQDFADVDTPRRRLPYRRNDHVLLLGPHDADALQGLPGTIVGSTRLESVLHGSQHSPGARRALVNLNFTFGVFESQAPRWIHDVTIAASTIGFDTCVSAHPAQARLRRQVAVTDRPVSYELQRSDCLITRFSTLIYEAIAAGRPVLYHNPHREQAGGFLEESPSVSWSSSRKQLIANLAAALNARVPEIPERVDALRTYVSIDPRTDAAMRCVDALAALL
jgi:hypothetical protein